MGNPKKSTDSDFVVCDACGKTVKTEDSHLGFDCDYCEECWQEAINAK